MIEIEKRVLLKANKFDELFQYFYKEGEKLKDFKRFTMVKINRSDFAPDPHDSVDIKVRTTGDTGSYALKYGNWHADTARSEYEVHFQTNEIVDLMNILKIQNYLYFIITYIQRYQYKYKDFEITLDQYFSMDAILMEIEISVEKEEDVKKAEGKISGFLMDFNLVALDSENTQKFIGRINNVLELRVDFTKTTVEDWFEKWSDYIYCRKELNLSKL